MAAVEEALGALSVTAPSRQPFTGSCHCGAVKYVVYMKTPVSQPTSYAMPMQILYRCNCSTCHKMGFFHLRLPSAPDDFALLAPLDPLNELGDYLCFDKKLHWLFCKTCGVRCFAFMGKGEVVEEVLPGVVGDGDGAKTRFWHPVKEGYSEGKAGGSYTSVNVMTIDQGQEGADLVEWTDQHVVAYMKHGVPRSEGVSFERPFKGGSY